MGIQGVSRSLLMNSTSKKSKFKMAIENNNVFTNLNNKFDISENIGHIFLAMGGYTKVFEVALYEFNVIKRKFKTVDGKSYLHLSFTTILCILQNLIYFT